MPRYLLLIIAFFAATRLHAQAPKALTPAQYREDFEAFWQTVNDEYAYLHAKGIDWNAVKRAYSAALDTVGSRRQFTLLLEEVLRELYDHHAGLNTNTEVSFRLVPTGADLAARFVGGQALIEEVRRGTPAARAGIRPGNIGYVRIHNSLGNNELIAAFDSVLNGMMDTRGLVLDMRETPSGGTSAVARGIMGRFLSKEGFYQKHVLSSEELQTGVRRSWMELVTPRGPHYRAPLVVLAGPWTGSMGEGIVIGLHGLKRAWVVGNRMAGLLGAIYSYRLPNSGIGYNLPAEQLFHVDGTPREQFMQLKKIVTDPTGADNVLEAARRLLIPDR